MKKCFLLYLALIANTALSACESKGNREDGSQPPQWITDLANSVGLEVAYGSRLPYINPYGSYGSHFIQGNIYTNHKVHNEAGNWHYESLKFVIFLCRKEKKGKDPDIHTDSLLNNYSYFLVFVESNKSKLKYNDIDIGYKVKNVLEVEGPVGMHFLQGKLSMELSEFEIIQTKLKKGPSGVGIEASWTVPIIIPYENSRQILVYYQDEWLINTLQEW